MNEVYIHRKIRKKHVFYSEEHYNDRISYVEVVSGCFFLMRSKVLEDINFLDENVFLYYEENILAKKIHNIGKKIMVCNDIKVKHNHSVSIDKNIKKINKLKLQKQSLQVYNASALKYSEARKVTPCTRNSLFRVLQRCTLMFLRRCPHL